MSSAAAVPIAANPILDPNALNANDGGKYTYTGFDYQSTTSTAWQDGFENVVYGDRHAISVGGRDTEIG
jgi:hypothetical protein